MLENFNLSLQIFQFLAQILNIYYFAILVRILISWFASTQKVEQHLIGQWLCRITDPLLRLFRKVPFAIIAGIIDISPILALYSISLLQKFFLSLAFSPYTSISLVLLKMFFQILFSIVAIVKTCLILVIFLILFRMAYLLFAKRSTNNSLIEYIDMLTQTAERKFLRFLKIKQSDAFLRLLAVFAMSSFLVCLLILIESWTKSYFL